MKIMLESIDDERSDLRNVSPARRNCSSWLELVLRTRPPYLIPCIPSTPFRPCKIVHCPPVSADLICCATAIWTIAQPDVCPIFVVCGTELSNVLSVFDQLPSQTLPGTKKREADHDGGVKKRPNVTWYILSIQTTGSIVRRYENKFGWTTKGEGQTQGGGEVLFDPLQHLHLKLVASLGECSEWHYAISERIDRRMIGSQISFHILLSRPIINRSWKIHDHRFISLATSRDRTKDYLPWPSKMSCAQHGWQS